MDNIIKKHHGSDTGFCRHYLTLYSVILGMEAKEVFEFGAGYSSYVILEALKKTGGKLTSCDVRNIVIEDKDWNFIQNDSRYMDIEGNFDVVLHDGSHEPLTVEEDLNKILPLMKKDSLILIHDTEHDYGLMDVVKKIDYPQVTLPYGYGLTIIRVLDGKNKIELKWKKSR